jgi:hypothetical protein
MVATLVGVWASSYEIEGYHGTPPLSGSGDFIVSAHLNYQFSSQNFERVLLDTFLEATPLLNT